MFTAERSDTVFRRQPDVRSEQGVDWRNPTVQGRSAGGDQRLDGPRRSRHWSILSSDQRHPTSFRQPVTTARPHPQTHQTILQ